MYQRKQEGRDGYSKVIWLGSSTNICQRQAGKGQQVPEKRRGEVATVTLGATLVSFSV